MLAAVSVLRARRARLSVHQGLDQQAISPVIPLALMIADPSKLQPAFAGTLIRAYGEYWSRDAVDWSGHRMPGVRNQYKQTVKTLLPKQKAVEVWEQRGIYALYNNFALVYVGQATSSEGIGSRLFSHHTKPRLQRRWDSFSWFGIDHFGLDGIRVPYEEMMVGGPTIARTLELVLILTADPPLNRAQGRFKDAEKIRQVRAPGAEKSVTEMLSLINEQLAHLKPRQ